MLNRWVLSRDQKTAMESAGVTSSGRLFQTRAVATRKARSPMVLVDSRVHSGYGIRLVINMLRVLFPAVHCQFSTCMGDRLWAGKSSRYIASHPGQLSLLSPRVCIEKILQFYTTTKLFFTSTPNAALQVLIMDSKGGMATLS